MNGYRFKILCLCLLALGAGIFLGPTLYQAAGASLASTPVQAASPEQEAPDDALESDGLVYHLCNIASVNYEGAYLTVYCSNPAGAVNIFLYPSSNAQHANRYLAVALTAAAAGKQLRIRHYEEASQNPATCNRTTCRGIVSLYMVN